MRVVRFLLVTTTVVGALLPVGGVAADARPAKPVITSVDPAVGSSVGYAHLLIHGRHLTGGTVTVAGRKAYAKVINSRLISAFPAGHHHGTGYKIVVRTKAGRSNAKRYEYRYARQPVLRAAAATAAPGGSVSNLAYSITRCPAPGTCVSIGGDRIGPVARVTTRGRTITQRVPVPAAHQYDENASLTDLSCPTATYCVAVGVFDSLTKGIASTWDGTRWTTVLLPVPTKSDDPAPELSRVSCGAPGHCVALDLDNVYTLDAGAWRVALAPAPQGFTHPRVARVTCVNSTWCTVVGSGDVGRGSRNFAAVRSGTTWRARALSNPPKSTTRYAPNVQGLDCAQVDRCTVFTGGLAGGLPAPLHFATLHAGTTHWTAVPKPADARSTTAWSQDPLIDGVLQCPTTGTCWALSAYAIRGLNGERGYQPVALRLQGGTSVRVYALPRPASSRSGRLDIAGLSCPTASFCVAVGGRGDKDVNDVRGDAIVETYDNGVWTPAAAPSPAGRPTFSDYQFASVDCPAVARCGAVGSYDYDHDFDDDVQLYKYRPVVLDVAPR